MKILTKEEEQEHYYATLKGGSLGGGIGLALGVAGVGLAQRRYQFIRQLTVPLKAFLVTSAGTFAGIISADSASRNFGTQHNPIDQEYQAREKEEYQAKYGQMGFTERAMAWGKEHRYQIVGVSWIASMASSFALVNRNKYLSGAQKLVQARVYAQFLTLGVLVASAAFEISDSRNDSGRYETVRYVDPKDPDHKRILEKHVQSSQGHGNDTGDEMWKDMIKSEEDRIKTRDEDEARLRKQHAKKNSGSKDKKHGTPDNSNTDSKDEKKEQISKEEKQRTSREDEDKTKETHEMNDEEAMHRKKRGQAGYGEDKKDNKEGTKQADDPQKHSKVPSANDMKETNRLKNDTKASGTT